MKKILVASLAFIIVGCSTFKQGHFYKQIQNKQYQGENTDLEVQEIYNINYAAGAEPIGYLSVAITDPEIDCSYGGAVNLAKEEARKQGANLVYIERVLLPGSTTACYRLNTVLYRTPNLEMVEKAKQENTKAMTPELLPGSNYAIVHLFRPTGFAGSLIKYDVLMDGKSLTGTMKPGMEYDLTITDYGEHTFTADKDTTHSLTLNIEKGKAYYICCGLDPGNFKAIPYIYLIDSRVAKLKAE